MGFLKEYRESKMILAQKWPVVFFAEKASDFQYLEHLLNLIIPEFESIAYITADAKDPLLTENRKGLKVFYSKNLLAHVLNHLKADSVVMTMPDLQQFIFKRSPGVNQYVYVFHALVSTHQQYRPGAFDYYDTILCAGPHHVKEIREREIKHQLKVKQLIPYGYPMLDQWKEFVGSDNTPEKILLAPSWYDEGILETCLDELLVQLRNLDPPVVIRFHPEFIKRRKKRYDQIVKQIADDKNISIDYNREVWTSLRDTAVLITDRSGIAFEFALATARPVVFIDTPPKKFNAEADTLGTAPIEDAYRDKIGNRVEPNALESIPSLIKSLSAKDVNQIRNELVFDSAPNEEHVKQLFFKKAE